MHSCNSCANPSLVGPRTYGVESATCRTQFAVCGGTTDLSALMLVIRAFPELRATVGV